MPPASLSTLAVMKPGPTTAKTRARRTRQLLSSATSVPMAQHRDHVVRRDDAGDASVLVDDGERDQVVLVEERRDFVLRRVRRACDVRLAEVRQLRGRRRDGDLDERYGADQLAAGAGEINRRHRFAAAFEPLERGERVVDAGCFDDRDVLCRHPAARGLLSELEELRIYLPLLGLHFLQDL